MKVLFINRFVNEAVFFLLENTSFIYICKNLKILQKILMNNSYNDLVNQTFNFPQEDFNLKDDYLQFNDVDIKALIDKYGTPLKMTYLPKIGYANK